MVARWVFSLKPGFHSQMLLGLPLEACEEASNWVLVEVGISFSVLWWSVRLWGGEDVQETEATVRPEPKPPFLAFTSACFIRSSAVTSPWLSHPAFFWFLLAFRKQLQETRCFFTLALSWYNRTKDAKQIACLTKHHLLLSALANVCPNGAWLTPCLSRGLHDLFQLPLLKWKEPKPWQESWLNECCFKLLNTCST